MTGSDAIEHGGALDRALRRYGGKARDWLDLSTGVNPHAYPVGRVAASSWRRLPMESAMSGLLAAARRAYRVPKELGIVAAPGAQALIDLHARTGPGISATIIAGTAGTYGEFARCCVRAGRVIATASDCRAVAAGETLVMLARPNNPDGRMIDKDEILALCRRLRGGLVVVDESFCDADPSLTLIGDCPDNLIVLRSFGKFYSLAGLRLGFAVGEPGRIEAIANALGPWPVSGPALEIGARALADRVWAQAMRARLRRESNELGQSLQRAGLEIVGGTPLFRLARHPAAGIVAERLAQGRILVRSFEDRPDLLRFGLPGSAARLRRLERALHVIAEIGE